MPPFYRGDRPWQRLRVVMWDRAEPAHHLGPWGTSPACQHHPQAQLHHLTLSFPPSTSTSSQHRHKGLGRAGPRQGDCRPPCTVNEWVFSHPLPRFWVETQLPTAALLLLLNDASSPETLPNTAQRKLDGENPSLETSFREALGNTPPPEDLRLPRM